MRLTFIRLRERIQVLVLQCMASSVLTQHDRCPRILVYGLYGLDIGSTLSSTSAFLRLDVFLLLSKSRYFR